MSANDRRQKPQKTPDVYTALRRDIIAMNIRPGADLDEKSLVAKFRVSRTPVREALIRLSGDGLVELRRNRGATVSSLDLQTLRSVFEASDLIERACIRLACRRRTAADLGRMADVAAEFEADMGRRDVSAMVDSNTRFHQLIAEASGNKYLARSYRQVLADHERIASLWYAHNFDRERRDVNQRILDQHRGILAAIEDRDPETADLVSMEHARQCKDGIKALLDDGADLLDGVAIEADDWSGQSAFRRQLGRAPVQPKSFAPRGKHA